MTSKKRRPKQKTDIFEQKIRPLERLLYEKRMPILFIGSGISRRYLDLSTWDSLLEEIASTMNIDRVQLNAKKKKIERDHPDSNIYPLLASDLSNEMIDRIS